MPDTIISTEILLGTDLSGLRELEAGLKVFGEKAQISKRDHYQLRLVLDELVTNTVSYGFASGIGSGIRISISLSSDGLCKIIYTDDAPRFDIVAQPVLLEKGSSEEAGFGGFGISLVMQIMDEVTYRYKDSKNIIRMSKKLASDNG
ncbi:MAG: anti-sigma regulatory factor (Ser/Thr protein kinase) [Desulforhopalus sp.]|jgi:anti-sigma regulatory factor (Ser/Thr protein kinase)